MSSMQNNNGENNEEVEVTEGAKETPVSPPTDDASRAKGEGVGDPQAEHRAAMDQPMVGDPQPGSYTPPAETAETVDTADEVERGNE